MNTYVNEVYTLYQGNTSTNRLGTIFDDKY